MHDVGGLAVVFSGARNHTHLLHVASWIREQLAATAGPVSLIDHDRRLSAADVAWAMPDDERLRPDHRHDALGDDWVYVAVGAPGVKPWLDLRRRAGSRPAAVVVVDEGLGTYGTWRTRRSALHREGSSHLAALARSTAAGLARRALTTRRWALYEHDGNEWSVNAMIAREFLRRIAAPPTTDEAVYLSQPLVELGLVTAGDYLAHLRRVAEAVDAAGLRFRLRPHRAESPARYEGTFDLIVGAEVAELEPEVVRARCVLGDTSTALLNVAAIRGIRGVRVGPAAAQTDRLLGRAQRSLLGQYLGEVVAVDDLAQVLSS